MGLLPSSHHPIYLQGHPLTKLYSQLVRKAGRFSIRYKPLRLQPDRGREEKGKFTLITLNITFFFVALLENQEIYKVVRGIRELIMKIKEIYSLISV